MKTGVSYERMHRNFKGESTYLAELDAHFPELTVGETLAFATKTRETTAATGDSSNAQPRDRLGGSSVISREITSLFDLDNAYNTPVGNAMIRGISGGEKRRTSIAEVFIGNAQFQYWDNSTRGLDSSTALRFIQTQREATTSLRTTVVMSLYQASEAMYEVCVNLQFSRCQTPSPGGLSRTLSDVGSVAQTFDKVMLLYEGRQIYFGPVDSAAAYFHELGFARPSRATTADFLTSLTNPSERVIRDDCDQSRVPRSPDDFARLWAQSAQAQKLVDQIDAFNAKYPATIAQPSSELRYASAGCAL